MFGEEFPTENPIAYSVVKKCAHHTALVYSMNTRKVLCAAVWLAVIWLCFEGGRDSFAQYQLSSTSVYRLSGQFFLDFESQNRFPGPQFGQTPVRQQSVCCSVGGDGEDHPG